MATSNLVNITILVPNGTVTHDDGHVLCVHGSSWRTSLYVATFFAANYAAHAATVKSNPGDKTSVTVCNIILALLFPVSGLMRAVNVIGRFGKRGGSDAEKAYRAGALCMVVRASGWIPDVGHSFHASMVEETWNARRRPRPTQDEELEELNDWRHHTPDQVPVANVKIYRPSHCTEQSSKWLYSDAVEGRANVNLAATKVHGSYSLPQGNGFSILPRDTRLLERTKSQPTREAR